jgi:long-subunit fatty acid transport protein
MYRLFLLIIVAITVNLSVLAQGNIGSPYTRYGIGDINSNPIIRNSGMGGLAYTTPYKNGINTINPAGIARIDTLTFIFDIGFSGGLRQYQISEPPLTNSRQDAQLLYLNFGFSILKKWKMAVGVSPFSNVGYDITANDTTLNANRNYEMSGNGGLSKVFWSNAYSPVENLSLGMNLTYLFGNIGHYNSIVFKEPKEGFLDLIEESNTNISDFNIELGIQYDLKLNSKNKLTIGALYSHNSNLNSSQDLRIYNKFKNTTIQDSAAIMLKERYDYKGKVSLPMTIGLGLGYTFDNKLYVGVDYTLKNWKGAQFYERVDDLKNGTLVAVGIEYTPAGYRGNPNTFWHAVSYRFGTHFDQNYFKILGNQTPINDFGMSFGLGLPMRRSRTCFDVSLKLGQRGTFDNNLIKEKYLIVGIGFNLNDIWFVKRKFD